MSAPFGQRTFARRPTRNYEDSLRIVEERLARMARLSQQAATRKEKHETDMQFIREQRQLKQQQQGVPSESAIEQVVSGMQVLPEASTAASSAANVPKTTSEKALSLQPASGALPTTTSAIKAPALLGAKEYPRVSPLPLSALNDRSDDDSLDNEDDSDIYDSNDDGDESPKHILSPFCITWHGFASRKVVLRGTFSTPYWQESLHLRRNRWGWSIDMSHFGLAAGTYLFKFVVDGEWKISPDYQVIVDKDGNTNNSIFISSSRRPLRPIQSLPFLERKQINSPGGHSDSDRSAKISRRTLGLERQITDSVQTRPVAVSRNKKAFETVTIEQPLSHRESAVNEVTKVPTQLPASVTTISTRRFYDVLDAVPFNVDVPKWAAAAAARQKDGLALVCGAWMVPHPEKVNSGGADAFFYSPVGFGIADGVGEWEFRFKINPRKFAEELMFGAMQAYDTVSPFMSGRDRANHCLTLGYDNTESFGSSTAAIAVFNEDRSGIGIANLGDSGILHLRKAKIGQNIVFGHVIRTADQQHSWNMPYQLTRLPRVEDYDVLETNPAFTQCIRVLRTISGAILNKIDNVSCADLYDSDLVEGDMLLAMTDGVKDNLWNHEMVRMIQSAISPFDAKVKEDKMGADDEQPAFTDPEAIAKAIAEVAFAKSQLSSSYRSPFSVEMRRQCGGTHHGGKPDDISVVVAWVVKESEAPRLCEQLNRSATGIMTAPQWWRERAYSHESMRSKELVPSESVQSSLTSKSEDCSER